MVRHNLLSAGITAAICLVGIAVVVPAQSERRAATLDDVVAEMRGLRADLNHAAVETMRMQLLTVRLTRQEQRIDVLSRERTDVLTRLDVAASERGQVEARVKQLQDSQSSVPAELGEQLTAALNHIGTEIARHVKVEQDLRVRETELSAAIAAEQDRWHALGARLDDLERSLTPGIQR